MSAIALACLVALLKKSACVHIDKVFRLLVPVFCIEFAFVALLSELIKFLLIIGFGFLYLVDLRSTQI